MMYDLLKYNYDIQVHIVLHNTQLNYFKALKICITVDSRCFWPLVPTTYTQCTYIYTYLKHGVNNEIETLSRKVVYIILNLYVLLWEDKKAGISNIHISVVFYPLFYMYQILFNLDFDYLLLKSSYIYF